MDVDKRVEKLKANLNQFTKEAAEIEIRLAKAKETLMAAEGLVGKLEDEFTRWSKRVKSRIITVQLFYALHPFCLN